MLSLLVAATQGTECDVSDAESVRQLGELAKKTLGRVDVWINNAGEESLRTFSCHHGFGAAGRF